MVDVIQNIVVPNGLAQQGGYSVPPYTSVHAHDTGNPNSSMKNERDYLAGHYNSAFYTHLVGWNPETNRAEAWQVAQKNQGAWDLGSYYGNANGYASVEFVGGSIKTQDQFNKAYAIYVELLRQLAAECGASTELDSPRSVATAGAGYVVTHNFASRNGFGSSHVDPLNFLSSWGITYEQFKKDIRNGIRVASAPQKPVNQFIKKGENDMLLFKADKATKYGDANKVYLLASGKVFAIESINSFNEMKSQGVPFTVLTIRNTEQIINAFGGVA